MGHTLRQFPVKENPVQRSRKDGALVYRLDPALAQVTRLMTQELRDTRRNPPAWAQAEAIEESVERGRSEEDYRGGIPQKGTPYGEV